MNWPGFGWGFCWFFGGCFFGLVFFLVGFFKQQGDPRVPSHLNLQFKFSEITSNVYLVRSDCCLQLALGKWSILIQQLHTTSKFVNDSWYFQKCISCKKFLFYQDNGTPNIQDRNGNKCQVIKDFNVQIISIMENLKNMLESSTNSLYLFLNYSWKNWWSSGLFPEGKQKEASCCVFVKDNKWDCPGNHKSFGLKVLYKQANYGR